MKLSRSGRVGVATGLWLAVGVMLIVRGLFPHFANIDSMGVKVAAVLLGIAVGGAKGWFVLAKSAKRTAGFIARRPEQDWIWMSFHPVLWAVIPLMIAMGLTLKHYCAEDAPGVIVGVYVGIGAAMMVGSRGFRAALDAPEPRAA